MVYKLKIYVKGLRRIVLICGEEFYKSVREDLENPDINFLDINNVIIPKKNIKKILVKTIENAKQ